MKSRTKNRKMIRLLAAALTLAMAVSMLAVPASAAGASAARRQTTEAAQQESGTGLNVKAAIGAVGIAAAVCLYWNPTARQKATETAQLALSDVASDAMFLVRGVTAGAKQALASAASDAKQEWDRRKDSATANENEGKTKAEQETETVKAETPEKTGTQSSAAQTTTAKTDTGTAAGESASVIVKLGGTAAAKADN